jgi:hypothetical protein
MIGQAVEAYLAPRRVKAGETVQFGWLIFRIAEPGPPVVLESLDFKKMASFTRNLKAAERVWKEQQETLRKNSTVETPCTLQHSALVSKSYRPGHPQAFVKRDDTCKDHASGWYVGIFNDPLSMDDQNTFELRSLYELSISDKRMLPYWLMPVGTTIVLKNGRVM